MRSPSPSKTGNTFPNTGASYPSQTFTGWIPPASPVNKSPILPGTEGKRAKITGEVFAEFSLCRDRIWIAHLLLSVVLTVIWQNGNKVVRNPFHPRIITIMQRMWVCDFEFDPISRVKKYFMVELVAVGIQPSGCSLSEN